MQLIQQPWGVAAIGHATVPAAPGVVRIRFAVIRRERSPSAAFAAAGQAVQAVRGTLRSHGVPDTGVQGSRLDLQTTWNYPDGRQVLEGYQCRAGFAVESADLDGVQSLLVDLVAAGADEVEAVEFGIGEAEQTQLRAQARRRAVADARSTAQLYADAAGVRLGELLHLEEATSELGGGLRPEAYRTARMSAGGPGAEDLAPGRIVVSATVVAGFAIAP